MELSDVSVFSSLLLPRGLALLEQGPGGKRGAGGNVRLLLCLLPGGGALEEGWLAATAREFRRNSEIFPTFTYTRPFCLFLLD